MEIQYVIAPNSIHHIFLQEWIDQFPDCKVIAPHLKEKERILYLIMYLILIPMIKNGKLRIFQMN